MQYTARWGPKGFLTSANKVVPFIDLKSSVSVKVESQNDTSGTAQTNQIGRDLQPISFSTTYLRAAGVDPRAEFDGWVALVGEIHPLIISGRRFGPAKLMLESVNMTDVIMAIDGTFLQAKVNLSFREYSEQSVIAVASAGASATASAAAAVYSSAVEKNTALNTGASQEDRAAKKTDRG